MRSSLLAIFILAVSPLFVLAAPSAPVKALSGYHAVLSVRDLPIDNALEKLNGLSGDELFDHIEGLSSDKTEDLVDKLKSSGKLEEVLGKIKDQDKLSKAIEKLGLSNK